MTNAKRKSLIFTLVFSLLLPAIFAIAPQTAFGITLLHEFAGGSDDGYYPDASLALSGSTLYGMTMLGGDYGAGVVFNVNTDGSGHGLLHEFAGGAEDGEQPLLSSLTLSGSTLYGMTRLGGDYNDGVVFKMNTDGSGYEVLHDFAGGPDDGAEPWGSLTLSGSTLYGITDRGGDDNFGTVFKMNTDGSGYNHLHEFAGGAEDGAAPTGSLILSGSTLYGMTIVGGDNNKGVVFEVNTDGSGYGLLHEFAGGAEDGAKPHGSLIVSGSTLYGMTTLGGDDNDGVVFKMNTDGSGHEAMHDFAGGPGDGAEPWGSLTLSGSTLYGMTGLGGDDDYGALFKMSTDGGGYNHLHEFAGGADDGLRPYGSLILSGSTLYGMTIAGGDNNKGVVFSMCIPEPSTLLLLAPGLVGVLGGLRRRRRAFKQDGSKAIRAA
ncbi:MAG: choice-of-anchor tandem repeat GloVer-containing protein [Planctomycetota bacterium]